jgi:hypothetical protein
MEILRRARLLRCRPSPECAMLDILLLGLGAAIFVLLATYVAACERV